MSVENFVANTLVSWKDISEILSVCFVFWFGGTVLSSTYGWRPSVKNAVPKGVLLASGIIYGFIFTSGAKGWEQLAGFPDFFKQVFILAAGEKVTFLSSLAHMAQVVGTFAAPVSSGMDQIKIGLTVVFAGLWILTFVGSWFFVRVALVFGDFVVAVLAGLVVIVFMGTKTLLKLVHPVLLKNKTYKSTCDMLKSILARIVRLKSFVLKLTIWRTNNHGKKC